MLKIKLPDMIFNIYQQKELITLSSAGLRKISPQISINFIKSLCLVFLFGNYIFIFDLDIQQKNRMIPNLLLSGSLSLSLNNIMAPSLY